MVINRSWLATRHPGGWPKTILAFLLVLGCGGSSPEQGTPADPAPTKPAYPHADPAFTSAAQPAEGDAAGARQEAFAARMREGMRPGTRARYPAFFAEPSRANLVPTFEATISTRGFREREFSETKPQGTQRVICIGNSVTFGTGVEADERYSNRLEHALRSSAPGPVEVLNVGWYGMQSSTAAKLLDDWVLRYDPDVVIVCLLFNDHRKLVGRSQAVADDLTQRLHQLRARFAEHPVIAEYQHNLGIIADSIEAHGASAIFIEPASAIEFPLLPIFGEALERVTNDRGIPLIRAADHYESAPPPGAFVEKLAEPSSWVYFFSLDGHGQPPKPGDPIPAHCAFFADPFHPSPAGHGRIAGALVEPVLEALRSAPRRTGEPPT